MIKNYMDNFTNEKPIQYSNKQIESSFTFIDANKKIYNKEGFELKAASKGMWEISISTRELLKKGDGFFVYILNGSFAHELQISNKKASNYISIESNIDINFEYNVPGFSNLCRIYLKENILEKAFFNITIKNANSYWTAGEAYVFIEYYNKEINSSLPILNMPFKFTIVHRNEVALLRVLGPTVATLGTKQRMHVSAFDICGNLMVNLSKEILIDGNIYILKKGMLIFYYTFMEEKVYRLKASIKGEKKIYTSNPIVCKKEPNKFIYWGDLHAHGWGDKSMHLMHVKNDKISPLARHLQGRDIGRFDFCAVGPMSFPEVNRKAIWDDYKSVCNEFNKEGEYIPFLSYEAHPPTGGDRNIFFKSLNEKLPPNYSISMYEVDDIYNKRDDVFVECHIGGQTPKFEQNINYRERMVEAISAFGNAEWLLQKVLKNGNRPAVCACSDLHYGLMGGPKTIEESRGRFFRYFNKRDSAFGTGAITAIISNKLNREELWDSMESRATYATNDDRVFIEFNVNDNQMGQLIDESDEYKIDIEVHGTNIIESLCFISGDYTIKKIQPNSLDYINSFIIKKLPGDFIYVRVVQKNGGFLLTSPIYISKQLKKWNDSENMIKGSNFEIAAKYLDAVINYIQTEENINKFSDITPIDIIDENITKCALFNGYFGRKKISIRWYFEYEVPRIRFDWGFTNIGNIDCEIKHNINNPD